MTHPQNHLQYIHKDNNYNNYKLKSLYNKSISYLKVHHIVVL